MTKPSRSIKRAWKWAGKPDSLKQYAQTMADSGNTDAAAWLNNKAEQRRAKKQVRHNTRVHTTQRSRGTQHLAGRFVPAKGDN